MTEDEILRHIILSCSCIIPEPKPDNSEIFDYKIEDGLKIRTCKTCRCSQCQSPKSEDWLVYCTSEYTLRVIDIYEKTGKYPTKCENCYDK